MKALIERLLVQLGDEEGRSHVKVFHAKQLKKLVNTDGLIDELLSVYRDRIDPGFEISP
jgi:hypothetical protein